MLFIVLDHPGSGQLGCCGSPFGTPSSGTLAASSLRCNNMPTAASCITGQPNQELPPAKRRLIFRAVLRGLARGRPRPRASIRPAAEDWDVLEDTRSTMTLPCCSSAGHDPRAVTLPGSPPTRIALAIVVSAGFTTSAGLTPAGAEASIAVGADLLISRYRCLLE